MLYAFFKVKVWIMPYGIFADLDSYLPQVTGTKNMHCVLNIHSCAELCDTGAT